MANRNTKRNKSIDNTKNSKPRKSAQNDGIHPQSDLSFNDPLEDSSFYDRLTEKMLDQHYFYNPIDEEDIDEMDPDYNYYEIIFMSDGSVERVKMPKIADYTIDFDTDFITITFWSDPFADSTYAAAEKYSVFEKKGDVLDRHLPRLQFITDNLLIAFLLKDDVFAEISEIIADLFEEMHGDFGYLTGCFIEEIILKLKFFLNSLKQELTDNL